MWTWQHMHLSGCHPVRRIQCYCNIQWRHAYQFVASLVDLFPVEERALRADDCELHSMGMIRNSVLTIAQLILRHNMRLPRCSTFGFDDSRTY